MPQVPANLEVAGVKVHLTPRVREEIQKEVFNIRKNQKYFQILVDRASLYFPIMERVLREQNVPDDIKFLAIQESKLISDAVSSSQAVGFWQFKYATGREVGLRIDQNIDERLNVAASTAAAARYFKKSNFRFRNWIYAVLAHYTGASGANKYVKEQYFGVSKMTVDHNMFWYVKRFIGHKIAYQGSIPSQAKAGLKLEEYREGGGQTLVRLAQKFKVDEDLIFEYNKWLKSGTVPRDKPYSVIIPSYKPLKIKPSAVNQDIAVVRNKEHKPKKNASSQPIKLDPKISKNLPPIFLKLNRIDGILSKKNETPVSISKRAGIKTKRFLRFNDLLITDKIVPGEVYYLGYKRFKARVFFHKVKPQETFWSVSQRYGLREASLKRLNRIRRREMVEPKSGETLWLREFRPKEDLLITVNPIQKSQEAKTKSSPRNQTIAHRKKALNNAPPSNIKYKTYIVIKGESLWSIANENNLHVDDLIAINTLPDNLILQIGQKIYIPHKKKVSNEKKVESSKKEEINNLSTEPEKNINQSIRKKKRVRTHIVKNGESLWSIAHKNKVTVDQLMQWNNLTSNTLQPGQELLLEPFSPPLSKSDKPVAAFGSSRHTVKKGDTIYGIARHYGKSVEQIMTVNKKNSSSLSIGEILIIPN